MTSQNVQASDDDCCSPAVLQMTPTQLHTRVVLLISFIDFIGQTGRNKYRLHSSKFVAAPLVLESRQVGVPTFSTYLILFFLFFVFIEFSESSECDIVC